MAWRKRAPAALWVRDWLLDRWRDLHARSGQLHPQWQQACADKVAALESGRPVRLPGWCLPAGVRPAVADQSRVFEVDVRGAIRLVPDEEHCSVPGSAVPAEEELAASQRREAG